MPRRARHPMAILAMAAAAPAVLLGALVVYAEGADDGTVVAATETTTATAFPAALGSPLLSVRRAPLQLADDHRRDVLAQAAQELTSTVDPTSCLAVGLDDAPIAAANAEVPVIPASNLKVVTAAAAVEVLGAGAVFTTKVVGPAPVDGVVQGDVHLVGGGDPVLSEQWYLQPSPTRKRPPFNATSIEALAKGLQAAGVTAITGSVIGDGSRYDDERHPPGWSESIRASVDGVPVGALVVNDSVSEAGGIASDPAAHAASVFRSVLRDQGVTVGGDSGTGAAPADAVVLATITSQPLGAIVNEMLATSDNLTAEMLVKELGVATAQQGTRDAGLRAMADRLVSWGVPQEQFVLTDGSGLSRENRMTCAGLLTVLQRGSSADVVGSGLATAGQDGSTLDGRFEEAGLAGVLRAKTGSLTGVKALCGYMPVGDQEVAFALILNGPSADGFAEPWSRLGALLLATAATPAADALAP